MIVIKKKLVTESKSVRLMTDDSSVLKIVIFDENTKRAETLFRSGTLNRNDISRAQ